MNNDDDDDDKNTLTHHGLGWRETCKLARNDMKSLDLGHRSSLQYNPGTDGNNKISLLN